MKDFRKYYVNHLNETKEDSLKFLEFLDSQKENVFHITRQRLKSANCKDGKYDSFLIEQFPITCYSKFLWSGVSELNIVIENKIKISIKDFLDLFNTGNTYKLNKTKFEIL